MHALGTESHYLLSFAKGENYHTNEVGCLLSKSFVDDT